MNPLALIAEDDRDIAEIIRAYLEREGSGPSMPATAVPRSTCILR